MAFIRNITTRVPIRRMVPMILPKKYTDFELLQQASSIEVYKLICATLEYSSDIRCKKEINTHLNEYINQFENAKKELEIQFGSLDFTLGVNNKFYYELKDNPQWKAYVDLLTVINEEQLKYLSNL